MSTQALRDSPMRRWAPHALRVGILAAVVGLVAWRVDWSAAEVALHPASWAALLLAITANFVSVGFKGLAWKGVVDGLPTLRRRTRYVDLLSPLFVGFLFNTVLAARLGEVVKVLLLRRRLTRRGEEVSATALLGTVVAENLIGTITWVALVIAIGLFLPLPMYAWVASLALGVAALAVVTVATFTATGRQLPPWLSSGTVLARVGRAASRLWGAVRESHLALRRPRQVAIVSGASLATWLGQWAGIYCTLWAFGLEDVGWGGAGLLLVTITLAQAFPVLPGNLVVFQAAAVLPLTATYGVSATQAIAFAVVLQFTEIVVGVLFGLVCLMAEGVSFGQLRRQAEAEAANGAMGGERLDDRLSEERAPA
jgi:uncharacterized membrane protein YbhN (UPF0104 family)